MSVTFSDLIQNTAILRNKVCVRWFCMLNATSSSFINLRYRAPAQKGGTSQTMSLNNVKHILSLTKRP